MAVTPPSHDMLECYRQAEALIGANLSDIVLNETISPNWVMPGSSFWYRRQTESGCAYVRVEKGEKTPAFDHTRVANAVRAAGGTACAENLDVVSIDFGGSVIVRASGVRYTVPWAGDRVDEIAEDAELQKLLLKSPDGRQAVLGRGHDLVLIDSTNGIERQLTDDGEEGFSWSAPPDTALTGIARQRQGSLAFMPWGWTWSPDGQHLVGGRTDERHVALYPFLESVPQDGSFRPKVWRVRQPLVGEPAARFEAWIIDVASGRKTAVPLPTDRIETLGGFEPLGWSDDAQHFIATVTVDNGRQIRLIEVSVLTGITRTIVEERSVGFLNLNADLYKAPSVRLIAGGRELIWFSQRSGWGHLYRYDMFSGALLNPVTEGEWAVRDIIHIDEARRRVFFTAGGREDGDPYFRYMYRVDFDGSDLTLLTPERADHLIDGAPVPIMARLYGRPLPPSVISPDGSMFVASHSTVRSPGATVLRSAEDGRLISVLEEPDDGALLATGWRPPEPFVQKASDGITDVHGVIYRPLLRIGSPVPVIDAIYGGPQMAVVPHNYRAARGPVGGYGPVQLVAMGFAVVVLDARGTPLRSLTFQNAGYENFVDIGLDDHIAVLDQLCRQDASLDPKRIGVCGHSFGGLLSARAILRRGDVYKVAVSSAGSHNLHAMYDGARPYLPPPDFGDQSTIKTVEQAVPENYLIFDNARFAHLLSGKLLLAYGDLDENALPAATLMLIDALTKANRTYDLVYMPNRSHGFVMESYFIRRTWDYFVTHLTGVDPPENYEFGKADEKH